MTSISVVAGLPDAPMHDSQLAEELPRAEPTERTHRAIRLLLQHSCLAREVLDLDPDE